MNGTLTGTPGSPVGGTITFPEATSIPTGTPGVFTGAGTGCVINGTFTPASGGGVVFTPTGNVPAGCTTGVQTGTITTTGLPTNPTTSGVPSNFTPIPPTTITQTNIGTSSNCTSTLTVTIGSTYSCVFPLTGDAGNNYALPTTGITASTITATGSSPACTIAGNGSSNVALVCSSIPTTGGSNGLQNVLVTIGGGTATDKGAVTLTNYITNPGDLLFIDPSKVSFTPVESSAVKFGTGDLVYTVNPNSGSGATGDTRLTAGGTTATCKFRVKEFGVADSDATKGFDVSTLKLAASVTGTPGGSYNTTTKTFDVPYSTTTGCAVKLPPAAQNQPKWFFETRVVRSDTQVFGRDNSYFQTYGAIGGVTVSG
jgi:hypothetical protein